MKRNHALLLGAAISTLCLFAKTTVVDYDHAANFGKYHTYAWISVDVQEPLWKDRVINAIDGQLNAKGWRKVEAGGDAAISAVGATHILQTLETWYTGGFGGGWYHRGWWGGPGFVGTEVEHTPIGTLHIDIFDTQTKKVIWHASISDTLAQKPDKDENKLHKNVADVFKNFPPAGM